MKKIKLALLKRENKNILSKMALLTTCSGPKDFYYELVILLNKDSYSSINMESAENYEADLILFEDSFTDINLNDFWIEWTGREVETTSVINGFIIR